jgi:hypothetical protein
LVELKRLLLFVSLSGHEVEGADDLASLLSLSLVSQDVHVGEGVHDLLATVLVHVVLNLSQEVKVAHDLILLILFLDSHLNEVTHEWRLLHISSQGDEFLGLSLFLIVGINNHGSQVGEHLILLGVLSDGSHSEDVSS